MDTESLGENTTTISWTCNYKGEPLEISNWYDKEGWDFVGCVVDIQLKGKDGYFFVKYTGTIEGIECDDIEGICKRGDKKIYHFGVEKFSGRLVLFRPCNIHAIRNHHSQTLEKEEVSYLMGNRVITPSVDIKLEMEQKGYEEEKMEQISCSA